MIVAIAAALVLVVVVAIVAVRRWAGPVEQRPEHDSGLRDAFVGILMTVGPFFGVRYRPPRVEIPVVTTPASDDLDPATATPRPGDTDDPPPAGTGRH